MSNKPINPEDLQSAVGVLRTVADYLFDIGTRLSIGRIDGREIRKAIEVVLEAVEDAATARTELARMRKELSTLLIVLRRDATIGSRGNRDHAESTIVDIESILGEEPDAEDCGCNPHPDREACRRWLTSKDWNPCAACPERPRERKRDE